MIRRNSPLSGLFTNVCANTGRSWCDSWIMASGGLHKAVTGWRASQGAAAFLLRCVALIAVLLLPLQAHAADNLPPGEEESSGFFQYFPAAPDIKLPKIDIVPFWTDDFKTGRKAYEKGNYSRAMKYFRRSSEDGNTVADWYLANMFRLGHGVEPDPAIAYSYYSRVAENFDPEEPNSTRLRVMVDSQLHLAEYQRDGIPQAGLKPDPEGAARTFLRLASTYGHPGAHFNLGVMTMTGQGVSRNPAQGLKWLTAAARKRHAEAEAYLGDLYWDGRDVRQSQTRALMWYTLAVETARADEDATIIARYQQMRSAVDEDTRLEAEARARVWAEQYPAAQNVQ